MIVGVLAFQGDVSEHAEALNALQCTVTEVRTLADCNNFTHLIIPGGESTVMATFLQETGVGEWIIAEAGSGRLAVFGTCAGAILLATESTGKNAPQTLGLINITIKRNAYGTQRDSFDCDISVKGIAEPVRAAFIRAPRITGTGEGVDILATQENHPVLVRQKRILAGTFHPEVRGSTALHQFFLTL